MRRGIITCASVISLICGFAVLVTGFQNSGLNPPSLRLGRDFYVTATHTPIGSTVAFYNTRWGPYTGSIVDVAAPGKRPRTVSKAFGPLAGVCYRHFTFPDGRVMWSFLVSAWYALVFSAILPLIQVIRLFRAKGIKGS